MRVYRYQGLVLKIVSGDAIWIEIDLGFRAKKTERVRLEGIKCESCHGDNKEAGMRAKDYLTSLLQDCANKVIVETSPEGMYGRWLATIYDHNGVNINRKMIADGYAVGYKK